MGTAIPVQANRIAEIFGIGYSTLMSWKDRGVIQMRYDEANGAPRLTPRLFVVLSILATCSRLGIRGRDLRTIADMVEGALEAGRDTNGFTPILIIDGDRVRVYMALEADVPVFQCPPGVLAWDLLKLEAGFQSVIERATAAGKLEAVRILREAATVPVEA